MKKWVALAVVLVVLIASGVGAVHFYQYLFAKDIAGEILNVERVNQSEMIITNGSPVPASQLFSFAISIKDPTGEIHAASSEDRQWAVAKPGQCVEAKFFPYPPWNLEKYGTYHNARLLRLFECVKH